MRSATVTSGVHTIHSLLGAYRVLWYGTTHEREREKKIHTSLTTFHFHKSNNKKRERVCRRKREGDRKGRSLSSYSVDNNNNNNNNKNDMVVLNAETTTSTTGVVVGGRNEEDPQHSSKSYELVKVCDSPFASVPLFLPSNVTYDPTTNTIRLKENENTNVTNETDRDDNDNHHHNNNNPPPPHLVKVPNAGWDMLHQLQQQKQQQDNPKTKKKTHNTTTTQNDIRSMSVISCVGPYRTGKSLLASRFFNTSKVFPVGPTLEGCTVGIWISTTAMVDTKTQCYKFVLDVEGLGDPTSGDDVSNTRLALACVLLSNVMLFNNTSHPDRGSLQFLRCLSTIRQRIIAGGGGGGTGGGPPTSPKNVPMMPTKTSTSFVWVFRDFFLQLPIRKTTGQPYTLEEYVLERVLTSSTSSSSNGGGMTAIPTTADAVEKDIVHSLLNDFAHLRVLKVGHPKLQHQQPLSPEEMAHLDDLDWNTLDEAFTSDIQHVITTCLDLATPFQLGNDNDPSLEKSNKGGWHLFSFSKDKSSQQQQHHIATPQAYAKWCDVVLELVNSSGIIPNLPDLQNQLVQQMANDQLAKCTLAFQQDMETYWNACPVYNNNNTTTATAADSSEVLKPVAEETELEKYAQDCFARLVDVLSDGNISSPSILAATITELEKRCVAGDATGKATTTSKNSTGGKINDDSGVMFSSMLTKIRMENKERSRMACEALAKSLYGPLQASVRDDPTCMSLVEFEQVVQKLEASYTLQARGPAKIHVLVSHIHQPSKADALFITKVMEKNEALQESLSKQAALAQDIHKKESEVAALSQDLEKIKAQTKEQMEALEKAHNDALAEALAAQHKREEEEREALRLKMEEELKKSKEAAEKERLAKQEELKRLQYEAEQRLKSEVEAREARLKQEKQLFAKQIESLKESADTELQEKLALVESKSREEHERLEAELTHRLEESESRLQEEIRVKEAELDETKKALEEKKMAEQELRERLERKICPDGCMLL